ncbi:haloacid dehalogenase type II [Ktedonosporobacter rubrisoli]|uniref:Haloacid dehalogenase type II n=1 Tax=Ktedonosporobacter rubrisoli TaxID=2509675 RepID=A0A4P6K2U0_KTERU|nr:haloacid dehalogenase type II [Ktedonosporobacter rubrisoli]QBD82469.1 haloacid dehalogenase type II [Ktedonosporobacter rubrisoli]
MSLVYVFDVNETLLDLKALDPYFEQRFGSAALRSVWFGQMLQSALVATITNVYADFGALGVAALSMLAERQHIQISEQDRQALRDGMQHLPSHPDVPGGLAMLRQAGLRLAALTNSTAQVGEAQLTNSGLRDYFEQVLSADTVKRLKPAQEPYHMAAERLGVSIEKVCLVAAHSWDIAGALRAGCQAAFIARPGMVLDPLVERPAIVGANLQEVATKILAREQIVH